MSDALSARVRDLEAENAELRRTVEQALTARLRGGRS